MNSYPPELLAQLAPVMFAAGLGPPQPPTSPVSPGPKSQDPFVLLATRLKDALLSQRKVAIWQPDKSKTFQVVLVDPDVRFPPRKMPPAEDQQFLPTHSPLSPLTPSSPLHPDGLIAPIWIRKHTTLVPSVFVLFKRIYESPRPGNMSPLEVLDAERERERETEERRRDTELSTEIAQRKKTTNDRSIKLTVVLMASRRMLDDPALDARLTYIRRQSGLDPRAALFVLSPVTQVEIGDFVRSLQEALFEPALDYYTNHSKRVRRKRNRHSQANSTYPMLISPTGPAVARPLRPEGWTVRYEYKMACFAEFRGEDEVALKHYQDAYGTLHIMFGSTAILPPRTKRWAEAKVLADCISVKICKLYLYNNEHSLALSHHTMHIRKFADLSRGWGIGEETFEFWSWLARQHRVFAELIEQGTRSALTIPAYLPASSSAASTVVAQPLDPQRSAVEMESLRTLGLNPTQALQHPGFYYFMAAQCTETRRARFMAAAENDSPNNPISSSPGFANESKVDHLTIILELYTRSYELFKKYSPSSTSNQGRQTLWIAYRIARTYHDSGKFDMAVKFFERIAKTYRREKWDAMLLPLLSTWYACAQQLGDVELGVQLLVEMLAHGTNIDDDEPDAVQEDLLAVFRSTVPSHPDKSLVIDLTDAAPLLQYSVIFWTSEVRIGERVVYQIKLTAPPNVYISSLPFTSLALYFAEESLPVIIRHVHQESCVRQTVQRIQLEHFDLSSAYEESPEFEGHLRWNPGGSVVLTGTLSSAVPTTISIAKAVLVMQEGSWSIELPLAHLVDHNVLPRWLVSADPAKFIPVRRDCQSSISSVSVRLRPHSINLSISHVAPAYLGEEYPILIEVTNTDSRELEITADALLQPSEIEGAITSISDDREVWSNLIKGVSFGNLAPGVSAIRTLYLSSSVAPGDRVIDLSIQSCNMAHEPTVATSHPPSSPSLTHADVGETLRTLHIPTLNPLIAEHSVTYRRTSSTQPGLAELSGYDDHWAEGVEYSAIVGTTWTCSGPHGIRVESVELLNEDNTHAKISECSVNVDSTDILTDWLPGDQFSDQVSVKLAPDEDNFGEPLPGPGTYEFTWRKILPNSEYGALAKSLFQLPRLNPPEDALVALLDVPTTAKLHTPVQIRMIVRNRRPTRSANIIVQVDFDPSDGFIFSGLRGGRIPILLPGGEEVLTWNAIPIECGYAHLPKIKVTDRRASVVPQGGAAVDPTPEVDAEPVSVVDIRRDERESVNYESLKTMTASAGKKAESRGSNDISVLVLP